MPGFVSSCIQASPCKAFCLNDFDNLESATDALALDDDIDGRMNEFANISAGQITATVAFLDQQCQLLKAKAQLLACTVVMEPG